MSNLTLIQKLIEETDLTKLPRRYILAIMIGPDEYLTNPNDIDDFMDCKPRYLHIRESQILVDQHRIELEVTLEYEWIMATAERMLRR